MRHHRWRERLRPARRLAHLYDDGFSRAHQLAVLKQRLLESDGAAAQRLHARADVHAARPMHFRAEFHRQFDNDERRSRRQKPSGSRPKQHLDAARLQKGGEHRIVDVALAVGVAVAQLVESARGELGEQRRGRLVMCGLVCQ